MPALYSNPQSVPADPSAESHLLNFFLVGFESQMTAQRCRAQYWASPPPPSPKMLASIVMAIAMSSPGLILVVDSFSYTLQLLGMLPEPPSAVDSFRLMSPGLGNGNVTCWAQGILGYVSI